MKLKFILLVFLSIVFITARGNPTNILVAKHSLLLNLIVKANNIARYNATLLDTLFLNDSCHFKEPSLSDIKTLCDCVAIKEKPSGKAAEHYDWAWERRLMVLAGTSIETDGFDVATKKLRCFWEKYKTQFSCHSSTFNLERGSLLKFAISQNFTPMFETMVGTYGMDINFIDPIDKRNVLDYVNDELQGAISLQGVSHQKVKVLKEYKQLLEDMGCKPSK